MIKTKDGYGKLIGSSYNGDATLVLLSNGGNIGYAIPSTGSTLVQRNTSGQIESSVGDTISPFKVSSVKVNENLNSDLLDGFHAAGLFQSLTSTKDKNLTIKIGDTELSINDLYATFDAAGNNIMNKYVTTDTAQNISGTKTFTTQLKFTYSGGAPFTVSSATVVTNLNADLLDGTHKADLFTDFSNVTSGTDANKLSITIGGTTKRVLVNYAQNAGSIGGVTLDNLFTALTSTPAKNLSATIGGITKDITSLYSNYWVFQAIGSKSFNDIHGDTYRGTSWYGGGSNTATNNPLGDGTAFGMQVWRNASGYTAQLIMSSSGRMYVRYYNGTTWSDLKTLAFTSDLSTGGYWADLPVLTAADATTKPTFAEATATTQVTTPKVHSTGRLTLNATSTALDLKYNNDNTKSVILNGTEFRPFDSANGKLDLGASDARWKGLYAGTGDFTGVVRTTGEGFYLASSGATYSRSRWISTNDGIWLQAATSTGSGTKGTLWITGYNNTNLTALKIKADTTDFNGTIGIASDGKIAATNTGSRQAGMYGIYDSTKVGHIWSMGTSYAINANGSNTGNLYGLAYFHTNWSNDSTKNDATKTEVSTYAGNHLAAWVINGKVYASLGNYVWSRNGFIKSGSDNNYALMGGGGHKAIGNVQNTAFYKRETSVNGTVWNMAGTTNSAAFTIYAPTTAGTSGYLLKSNGTGAPVWMDPTSLSIGNADSVDGYHALKSFSSAAEIDNTAFFWTASGAISDVSSMSYAALLNVVGNSTRRWLIWNSRNDHLLYWRPEKSDYSGYADVHILLDNYNFKKFIKEMYWANVLVSDTSSTTTKPTFGGLTVNGTSILNGLVGIGVLSPKAKLAVNISALSANPSSGSLGTVNTMSVGAAGSYGTYFWTRGTGKGYILVGREDGTATVYDLILQVLGGNVGIGKESPSYKLDVASTARVASIVMEYNNEINVYGGHLYLLHRGTVAGSQGDARTSNIYMCANGGNVGIGTASLTSGYRVTVNGGVTATRFQTGSNLYNTSGGIILNNSDIYGLNAIYTSDLAERGSEGYLFKRTNGNYDSIWCKDGTFYFSPDGNNSFNGTYNNNYVVLHSGNYTSYSTQSKIWTASTTVNAWRRILTINGYSNVLLSMCWSLNSQASLHLYLINTGYLTARIVQLGYNGYSHNYSILIRVTYTAATTFHVEVYNTYGYNGATTLSVGCRATVLDNTCSITTITANTAGGGTSLSSLTSHYNIAKNFYVERATVADSLYTGSASGSSHANALQTYFNANKASIPRNRTVSFYSSAYSNGSLYMGYFLSGYDSNPYGGFFVAHYGTPYYVGINNGSYSQSTILTTGNYTSTLDGRYVNVTGDTMTGTLILKGSTSTDMTYSGNTHPALRFDNSDSSLNIKIIFTDYDNYRSPAGLKVIGNQGSEWFEVSGFMYAAGFVKNGSNNNYALTGGGGHFGIHTGRNNEANKIVRTDGNGYILAGWINTTSGDMGTTAINRIYCSNDGYIRYKTPANFFSTLSNSGSQISVTVGSQNRTLTVGYSSSSGYISASSISNLNTPSTWSSDGSRLVYDIYSGSASNKPVSVNNANGLITLFKSKHGTSGQYVTQIAAPDNGRLYTRYSLGGSWQAWRTLAWTSDIPSVGNGTIIINLAGAEKGRFTVNQSGTTTINLTDNNTNTWRGIENVLTSTSTSNSLTANMGRVLANGASDRPIVLLAGTLYRNGASSSYTTWGFTGYRHRSISSTNPTISVSGGVARFYFTNASGYGFSFALVCANHQASGEATSYMAAEYKTRSSGLFWFGTYATGQYLYIRAISLGDQNNDTAISYAAQWTTYGDGITRVSIIAVGYAW